MDEKWKEFARARNATYISAQRDGAEDRGEATVIRSSAEPFHEQRVSSLVRSARKNAEQSECRQREGKTCLHGFYCRCFCNNEPAGCAVLKKPHLTGWELLSYRA